MAIIITRETKRGGQRKAKRRTTCKNKFLRNKIKNKTSFSCGRKLSHPRPLLMSLACKWWDLIVMGGLEHASLANVIFLFMVEAKACWNVILTHCLKIWMQKDKDKWPFDHLSWKWWTQSLMKLSISYSNAPCTSVTIKIKWCPSWGPPYLRILAMVLSSTNTFVVYKFTSSLLEQH
jgi:hypothetical protein